MLTRFFKRAAILTTRCSTMLRHRAGKVLTTLVVTIASVIALSTAPANATTPVDGLIRNAAYKQCIDAPGGKLNVRLKLVRCSTSGTQQWEFIPTEEANTYVIRNRASGFCMEVNNGTSNPGEIVDQYTCNRQASEQWVLEGSALRHAGTNQCLDTVSGPGSELMQYTCGQAAPENVQDWLTGTVPTQISVSNEGVGLTSVFTVTGSGFTPNSLVVIRFTVPSLEQRQFAVTARTDGKFESRHGISCASGVSITVTAFEDANPKETFANVVVTTCP
jgi:Ricin-type beta-trefoil lectin domain